MEFRGGTGGRPSIEGVTLDAEALCKLLARLDVRDLPELIAFFPFNGPQSQPLFRGPNAELLLVRWSPGQTTPVSSIAPTTMAVRPIEGELEIISFAEGDRGPAWVGVETVRVGQIAGIPSGALHSLHARGSALTLHLCSPPVVQRREVEVGDWF